MAQRCGGRTRAPVEPSDRAPIVPHNISWTLLALGDRAIIQRIDGASAVGRFQVSYTIGAVGLSLVSSVANAWLPIVFSTPAERRWSVYEETLRAIQVLAALVAGGLAIVGPVVLWIATPDSYHQDSLPAVVALVALSAFPWVIYGGGTQILLWHRDTRSLAWKTPLAAAINLLLVVALLPWLGLPGAALATLLAYTALAVLITRTASQHVSVRNFGRSTVVSWGGAAAMATIGAAVPVDGSWLAVRAVLGLAIGACFLLAVRRLIATRRSFLPRVRPELEVLSE